MKKLLAAFIISLIAAQIHAADKSLLDAAKAKEDPVIFEHLGDALIKNGLDEDAAAA